jgi:hypothetical protein
VSCEKNSPFTEEPAILGKWQWIKSVGGLTGNQTILPEEGINTFLEIFSDSSYRVSQTGSDPFSNIYSIRIEKSIFTNQNVPVLTFYDQTMKPYVQPQIIRWENQMLVLQENCTDCFSHFYIAVK